MDVSIIVVNWNTKALLCDCLKSIYEQAGDVDFEVIVIDNASMDGSAEMVKKDFPQVILIENSENRGFAAANNQGISIAKSRYILLLNSDTVILDKAIATTIMFAEENPQAGVVGCRVLNPDMTLQRSCFMYPSVLNMFLSATYLYKVFPRSRFFGREAMTWWDRTDVREVDVVTGCFMLVRRTAIDQVGMMDENYFMYSEEADWCYRFRQNGWDIRFAPVGEIIHLGGQSTSQMSEKMNVQLRLSILKFIEKHQNWFKHKIACLLTIMFFALRIPTWLSIAMFNSKRRKQALAKARTYFIGIGKVMFERHRVRSAQS